MKKKILCALMLALILTSVLNVAFTIKLSSAQKDENKIFDDDFIGRNGEAALSNNDFAPLRSNDLNTDWQRIFERKLDAQQEKTIESYAQNSRDKGDGWNFNDTSKWSEFAYVDGNKTRLIVGVNGDNAAGLPELEKIAAKHHAKIVNTISIKDNIRAVVVELPLMSVTAFIEETRIMELASYIEPNMQVQAQLVPNDPYWSMQWGSQRIEADWAWNTTVGDPSILVAVVDTGIYYTHSDLEANYAPLGYDWVNMDADPMDDHGHGTHCAGIIAATLNNGVGMAGLAQVRVMAEKVLDSGGYGYWDWVANGIINATDRGADIISMSLGGYGESELVHEAVKYAYDAGVLVIAAAGNDNTNMKLYPAGYDEVVAVAATDQSDNKAWFSNWGDWIELAAPGVDIYSTVPWGYESWSGTSMATPHVSGVAALVWSLYPDKTRDWVRLWLRYAADDLGDEGFDVYYGYGRVNARKAVEQTPPAHELIAWEWETPPYVEPGTSEIINATVLNFGENSETDVLVQLLANGTIVDSTVIGFLASGDSATASLTWSPTIEGLYNVTLYVVPVLGEARVENNVLQKYIYVGFPVKAVVLHSAGNVYDSIITNWQVLSSEWHLFGETMIYIDYTTLNKEDITYEDIAATEADVLIISCAFDRYAGWQFADSEIDAIKRYVYEGHGLIVTAGTFYSEVPNNNKLAPLFGLNENIPCGSTLTDLLHLVNAPHPIFAKVPNPLVFPWVGTALPYDGRWDSNELTDGEYLALGHFQESAIVTCRGFVYISPWLEVIPPYYHHHLQLLYNAIMWSRFQRPQHELVVSLEAPTQLQIGESVLLNVTVSNLGLNDETDVELYLLINDTVISSVMIPELLVDESYTINYAWAPTSMGAYNVTAYASPVPGEEYTANNIVTKSVFVFYTRLYLPHQWVGGGNPMGWYADDFCWQYTLPFDFPFYDVYYRTIYISSNGLITFLGPDAGYWNSVSELAGRLAIAPAWDDWVTYAPYDIYIWQDASQVGIRWYVRAWGSYVVANFEVILRADGLIQFNYGYSDGPVSATIGISNGAGHILAEDVSNINYINTILFIPFVLEHELVVQLDAPVYFIVGSSATLNATIFNFGLTTETDVTLQLFINDTLVDSALIPELATGTSYTLSHTWTPTVKGTYNITAYAPPVENEAFVENNMATRFVTVMQPLIQPIEGQYANYTIYYVDPSTGVEISGGLWNFTYLRYISPYQINVTMWMEDYYGYTQSGWMIVNILTRIVESDSGIYWTGMYYPGWIETDVTIGSSINLLGSSVTIMDNEIVYVNGRPIDCWEILMEQYGWTYAFWYDKASGLWIGMRSASSYGVTYLMLEVTNVPIGFAYEHDLVVTMDAPTRLLPGTTTILNATVYNIGLNIETSVPLQLAINGSIVAEEVIPELAIGDFYILSYSWAPSIEGIYNVTVYTPPVLGEEYIENNIGTKMINVQLVSVALISDYSELSAITYILDSMGINYHVYNSNNIYLYTANLDLLLNYRIVIFYTDYRWITSEEQTALNAYISQGGNLIVTGFDCLVSDTRLADVVRSSTTGDNVGRPELYVVDATHPIMNGPYGSFPAGYYITGLYGDCDRAQADIARGAVTVAELTDGYDKIIATELSIGKVVFWNGRSDFDWVWNTDCQAMFKNMVHWMSVKLEHDLAVSLEVPAFLTPGASATLNATVRNRGLSNETNVELQLWINGTVVKSEVISELLIGSSYVLTYLWAPVVEGAYNITAYAPSVENETFVANNVATRFSTVAGPLIRPVEGQYANYTLYILERGTGEILGTEKWNFTYAHYISSTQIYVEVWIRTQEGYEQNSWMIVNTVNRYVEAGMWAGTWYRGWMERNIDVGSRVGLESGYATVVGSRIISAGIRQIDCWELLTDYGGLFWYDKTTGLWISAEYLVPPYYVHRLMLDYTNVPIGFEHELSVTLRAPSSLLVGTSTLLRATVHNLGLHDETQVELYLFINGSIAASATIPELPAGSSYSISYSWSPSEGQYNVTAYALPVPDEGYVENNVATKMVRVFEVTGTYIYVNPLETTAIIGDTFTITVNIADVEDLYTWQVNLQFDPVILECTGAWYPAGHVFENRTFLSVDPNINNIVGYVLYGCTLLGEVLGENVTEGILCQISFRTRAVGSSSLIFRTIGPGRTFLFDSNSEDIPFTAIGGVAEVVEHILTVYDVAITDVVPLAIEVYVGWALNITVIAQNEGDGAATFTVSAYYNTSLIGIQTVYNLAPGENITLIFIWDTTGLQPSSCYVIRAEASVLPGEINTDNNVFINGIVRIKMLGDINGDGIIDYIDIFAVASAFGSNPDGIRWNQEADLNRDGFIDMLDIYIVARNFGRTNLP